MDEAAHRCLANLLAVAVWCAALEPVARAQGFEELQALADEEGAADDRFGSSVAADGNTVVIGVPRDDGPAGADQGSAHVFVRIGDTWSLQQKLTAPDAAAGDRFGGSVAIDGDTLVVGAANDAGPAGIGQGSAYAFVRSGDAWSLQQKLTASDAAAGDAFGNSVAIDAETAVVGAYLCDGPAGLAQGSVYVFERRGTTWSQRQKLTASFPGAGDTFGTSVDLDGDTIVVGAPLSSGIYDNGTAYVFVRYGESWFPLVSFFGGPEYLGQFGNSVAVDGDTIAIGAFLFNWAAQQGLAFVSHRQGETWSPIQQIGASDPLPGDNFGSSVAIEGDTLVVGAAGDDGRGGMNQGSAYVFVQEGGNWIQRQKISASDAGRFDAFGSAVAIETAGGDRIVVGAHFTDGAAGADQGSAYIFVVPCGGDADGDALVGITDLLALLATWGVCPGCPADLDGDGEVGVTDLLALLAAWGPCP